MTIVRARAARRLAARPAAALAWPAFRVLTRLGAAALVVFHAWLLGLHVVSGRAFEPATALRWALAILVIAGFHALSRRGLPLFFGRRAVGLWLLVILIHCTAGSDGGGLPAGPAIPTPVTALAQVSAAAFVIGAWLAAAPATAAGVFTRGRWAHEAPPHFAGLPAAHDAWRFAPRPPPLA